MIARFLMSKLGLASVIGIASVIFGAWRLEVEHQRSIGAQKLAQKIEKVSNEKIAKAERARRSRDVNSIPDERLRDPYFRD